MHSRSVNRPKMPGVWRPDTNVREKKMEGDSSSRSNAVLKHTLSIPRFLLLVIPAVGL